jgi:hypothetical protein
MDESSIWEEESNKLDEIAEQNGIKFVRWAFHQIEGQVVHSSHLNQIAHFGYINKLRVEQEPYKDWEDITVDVPLNPTFLQLWQAVERAYIKNNPDAEISEVHGRTGDDHIYFEGLYPDDDVLIAQMGS